MSSTAASTSLRQFSNVAQKAANLHGALKMGADGNLAIEGKNWMGRKTLWLKSRIFPQRMRTQNMAVLNQFAHLVRRETGNAELAHSLVNRYRPLAKEAKAHARFVFELGMAARGLESAAPVSVPATNTNPR